MIEMNPQPRYHQMLVSPHVKDPAQAQTAAETTYRHVREHRDMNRHCERVLREYDEPPQA